jgi:hypothetical protein
MGLDMHLEGHKYIFWNYDDPKKNRLEDGFRLRGKILELGYWRKHPNLHGYIVTNFAGGVDECQEIELTVENLEQTLKAVVNDVLPETSGFFFGKSEPEDKEPSIEIIEKAIEWLKTTEDGVSRSVIYRASW